MKRFAKIALATGMLAVFSFSGCDWLMEGLKEDTVSSGTESLEIFNDVERYEIFNGEYEEVDMNTVVTKIVDDSRYKDENIRDVWKNNLGTQMSVEGYRQNDTEDDLPYREYHEGKILRKGETDEASRAEYKKHYWSADGDPDDNYTKPYYYYEEGIGYRRNGGAWKSETGDLAPFFFTAVVDFDSLRETISWWEETLSQNDDLWEDSEWLEDLEVDSGEWISKESKILMCEDDQYTKVAFVAIYDGKVQMDGKEEDFSEEYAAAFVFTKDLRLIAAGTAYGIRQKGTDTEKIERFYAAAIPWEGTISRPDDL